MLLVIPYNTDAPLYHLPLATGGIIIVNILAYCLQVAFPDASEAFILQFGVINPIQWLTSFFMHADIFHLLGNMSFLFIFGLVVEGKIGWKLFVPLYLAIGLACSVILQTLMIGASEGGALGASAAVYGIMAVAMFWAPMNEINCKCIGWLIFYPFAFGFDISISSLAFFYLAGDFFWAYLIGFSMNSSFAHLTGAIIGGVFGYLLIKYRRVNCEGYDLFSMWQGKTGEKPPPTIAEEKEQEQRAEELKIEFQNEIKKFNSYVKAGHVDMAHLKMTHLKRMNKRFKPGKEAGWLMVQGLIKKQKNEAAVELIEEMIGYYPDIKTTLLINLSKIFLQKMDRPRKAIETLNRLSIEEMTDAQAATKEKIVCAAFHRMDEGQLEVGD